MLTINKVFTILCLLCLCVGVRNTLVALKKKSPQINWPCFTWKFFMIWFHKILKLIFQKQPSFPRNICTEHWRKLPNLKAFLEIFLYLKSNDSVEHVLRVLLIMLFIYFRGKIKISHYIWSIYLCRILILI